MSNKILVVEDDRKIVRIIELQLKHAGYNVDIAYDGERGEYLINYKKYDLILLDIMLPKINGFELCRRIREKHNTPIIMLTAKNDVSDKILGLDFGANDYLTKPFDMQELLARIRVQLRHKDKKYTNIIIKIDDLEINTDTFEVKRQGNDIMLSKTEFDLLTYLAINRGIVLKRDVILDNVWGYNYFGSDNILDVYIKYVRDKIDKPYEKKLIKTVRGIGYVIK